MFFPLQDGNLSILLGHIQISVGRLPGDWPGEEKKKNHHFVELETSFTQIGHS